MTAHEVIEAPGKVVVQVCPSIQDHGERLTCTTQITVKATLIDGVTYDYDGVGIISLVEEDGEIKILECKEFCDPHKRINFYTGVAKAVAQRVPGS